MAFILLFSFFISFQEAASANSSNCNFHFAALDESKILSLDSIQAWKKLPASTGGDNHLALYEAKRGNDQLFIKVSFAKKPEGEPFRALQKEADWVDRLARHNVGPRFYGVVESPEGLGIATEYVAGNAVSSVSQLKSLPVNSRTLSDLRKIREVFVSERIHPMDFQFILAKDGSVKVIDPPAYLLGGRDVPLEFRKGKPSVLDAYIDAVERQIAGRP